MSFGLMLFGFVMLIVCGATSAFEAQPLVHELSTSGANASSSVRIRNTTDRKMHIELGSYNLALTEDGFSTGESAEEVLLVFPPAMVLDPYGTQVARIQWAGPQSLANDQSYVVAMEQLPIDIPNEAQAGISMLLTFNALVHVVVDDSRPVLNAEVIKTKFVDKIDESTDIVKSQQAVLRVTNTGNGNAYGSRMSLNILAGEDLQEVDSVTLNQLNTSLFVSPGDSRELVAPLPSDSFLDANKVEITMEYAH